MAMALSFTDKRRTIFILLDTLPKILSGVNDCAIQSECDISKQLPFV